MSAGRARRHRRRRLRQRHDHRSRKLDLTLGARFDRENRKANLADVLRRAGDPRRTASRSTPRSRSPTCRRRRRSRITSQPDAMVLLLGHRRLQGGRLQPGVAGRTARSTTRSTPGTTRAASRARGPAAGSPTNLAVFSIDWQDLQLNLPNPQVPGQFYISNVGQARSSGVEFELNGQGRRRRVGLFATFGVTRARFGAGTTSSGQRRVGQRDPEHAGLHGVVRHRPGAPARRPRSGSTAARRSCSTARSSTTTPTSRGRTRTRWPTSAFGARGGRVFAEGWIRNAFDTKYIPVAFQYDPRLAPSGFIGESGRPRTFGITAGVNF